MGLTGGAASRGYALRRGWPARRASQNGGRGGAAPPHGTCGPDGGRGAASPHCHELYLSWRCRRMGTCHVHVMYLSCVLVMTVMYLSCRCRRRRMGTRAPWHVCAIGDRWSAGGAYLMLRRTLASRVACVHSPPRDSVSAAHGTDRTATPMSHGWMACYNQDTCHMNHDIRINSFD